ncbi:MAG: hypothetical protein EZS28_046976, partial [Streblomastix strix]
ITTPYHVKCGILDVLLKLITSCDDLEPTSILIPILTELQKNGQKEIKKKSQNIFFLLNAKGINSPSSEFESESLKEKEQKIQQLEEQKRIQETEINKLKQENSKEKQEKEKERIEKERKDSEINKLKQENSKEKQEKERERNEKERKEEENKILKEEIKKMKKENEKLKPKPPQDFPIAIHNPDPSDIDFSDIDGKMKKITKKEYKNNTISLSQILENGIWEIETEFSGDLDYPCIGVMKDSFNFTAEQHSTNYSDNGMMEKFIIRIIRHLEIKDIQQVRK